MKMLFKSPLRAVDGDDVAAAPSEPMVAPVSPVQAAREKLRRAVDREQEIREGQVDLQLGIEGAAEDLAALQQKRDMLMRKLFHS